ncbi:Glycosyltransferase involved in cell wall bisynthesis [Moheibacter sediminis]|uniref:Glycosyltransferase involved in cell wall bisynthesis n=2 Tax=Moheibacter sediminis TaxID=1434700 RepID=A0A1W2AL38_9FLAO|nr:Glycosyltransferase involved in cell wall bisynthesis [Moheibacter sediminis]
MKNQHKKIKILFRLRSLEMGGVQKVILDFLENLPQDKFDITFLVNLKQGILINSIPKHVRFLHLTEGRESFSDNKIIKFIQLVLRNLKLRYYKKYPKTFYDKFGLNDIDVEIASSYTELEDILNSPNKKSKKVGWFHTDIRFVEKNLALKFISWMKQYDVMIFGSKQTRNVIKEFYDIDFPKGKVIYNVIDGDLVNKKSLEFTVERNHQIPQFISVARLQKRKNFDDLAKVHKRILDEGLQHEIIVIGDGDFRPEVEALIKDLKIHDSFKLLGTQKNPYPYIKAADYFILPSKTESYPLIIGETLCLAKPIISTDVGGINEMIDNDIDGMLIHPTEQEIYEAMKKFLTDEEYVSKLQVGAQKAYLKFQKELIYNQVIEILES